VGWSGNASEAGRAMKVVTKKELAVLFLLLCALLLWSAYQPYDRLTWFLEVLPVVIAMPLIWLTYAGFPLTPLLTRLIVIHAIILIIGGHYTYARVPLGFWVQDLFDLGRNHYDRLGHLAQGFIPAILAREILLRKQVVKPGPWLFYVVVSICLAFSAFYELLEWWAALLAEEAAIEFLGTQGDIWDTQWDMFLALLGTLAALLLLGGSHDRQLNLVSN
jgi:putative membrane protein